MKRAVVVLGMVSLFIFAAIAGYAEMAKKPITAADLSSLKGKWKGERVIKGAGDKYPADMEIVNDKLPLKGKLNLYHVMREGSKDRTEVIGLGKSELTKNGGLLVKGALVKVELFLYTEGSKMKLEGNYQFQDLNGILTLIKQ